MVRDLGFRHVEVIYAVILTGTFTGAAARLCVSQPAVSNSIKEAEERLGFPLFTRQHGRVFPTKRATAIFSEIQRSFTGLDAINTFCMSLRHANYERLLIASNPAWATAVLPLVLSDFLVTHPNLCFSVITRSSEYVQSLVSSFKADIGFGLLAPPIPGVTQRNIASARLHCVLPAAHPLARKSEIHVTDLADERLITFSNVEGTDHLINQVFFDHGLAPHSVVVCPAALTVCAMIEAGIGAGLVHGISTHVFRDRNIVCLPFKPELSISMCAYWRTSCEFEFDHEHLVDLAVQHTQRTLAQHEVATIN